MGSTELRTKGADFNRLTDKQAKFVLSYLVDFNGTKAAKEAGYSAKTAGMTATKLLRKPAIKAIIGNLRREQGEKFIIEANDVLRHLCSCALRDGKDFVDKDGRLILTSQNINDLPDDITRAVNSIKQKRRVRTEEDGTIVEEIETELKLVDKGKALEMCMQHKGLFAAEKVEVKLPLDFDTMYEEQGEVIDVVEKRLIQEEKKD